MTAGSTLHCPVCDCKHASKAHIYNYCFRSSWDDEYPAGSGPKFSRCVPTFHKCSLSAKLPNFHTLTNTDDLMKSIIALALITLATASPSLPTNASDPCTPSVGCADRVCFLPTATATTGYCVNKIIDGFNCNTATVTCALHHVCSGRQLFGEWLFQCANKVKSNKDYVPLGQECLFGPREKQCGPNAYCDGPGGNPANEPYTCQLEVSSEGDVCSTSGEYPVSCRAGLTCVVKDTEAFGYCIRL
jgi:hypothetical protein